MKKIILFTILCLTIFNLSACGISQDDYDTVVSERDEAIKKNKSLSDEIDKLKSENEEYESIIKPYKDLSDAEILEQTNKANLKAKEDEIALEELEKKEAAEKEAAEKKKKEAAEKEAKKGYETGITYNQLARTPDDYTDKKVKFTGTVIQVLEADSTTQIRLAVNGDYNDIVYGEYSSDIVKSRVLDDDTITIYGVSKGLLSYESTIGGTITIPSVYIEKIDQ